MKKSIPQLHETILKHLLKIMDKERVEKREFTFYLRKSDLSKKLSLGYWFLGNEDYIALSFWSGMDWVRKVPNIGLIINIETGDMTLQFSYKDSLEKKMAIQEWLFPLYEKIKMFEEYAEVELPYNYYSLGIKAIDTFIKEEKKQIDGILYLNQFSINTRQNSRNQLSFIALDEFERSLKKIKKFRQIKDELVDRLPISLKEIHIDSIGPLKNLKLNQIPKDTQWIFITGVNGTGKTSVLKGIALGLTNGEVSFGPTSYIKTPYKVSGKIYKAGQEKAFLAKRTRKDIKSRKIISKGFAAYGPVRINLRQQKTSSLIEKEMKVDFNKPYASLFSSVSPLTDLGYIYNSKNLELRKILRGNDEKLKYIIEAITSICENIVDMHFGRGVEYFERNIVKDHSEVQQLSFNDLSSGYKNIIAMVSDMMLHLYYQQQNVNDPSELHGIILIDEIDMHLHPQLQKEFVTRLSEIFPRVQFIATTHSPFPLLGAPDNTIVYTLTRDNGITLKRMDDKVPFSILTPNAILTSPIFGIERLRSNSANIREKARIEDTFDDAVFKMRLEEEIEGFLSNKREKEIEQLFNETN